jgi:putative pyruvate formate lyase activating enzyme
MNYLKLLDNCTLCLRNCKVNRNTNQIGFCKASNQIEIARASLHLWEEPPISQGHGSGTIFFSHCNLKCVFCQNHDISQGSDDNPIDISSDNKKKSQALTLKSSVIGLEISIERLAEIFLELQDKGANNIKLVTPTH